MERVNYVYSDRSAAMESINAANKAVTADVLIELDENGMHQTCYFIVEDAPAPPPDLLAEADARLLELEYENLLLKGGFNL